MIFAVHQNTITAYGIIWEGNGMEFVATLSRLETQYGDITIKLHTYGGSVFDGNLMFNALSNSKSKITLQIVGIAASMGFILSQSKNVKTTIVSNGYMMCHLPSGSTWDGTAKDHENNAKLLRSIEKNMLQLLVNRTGKPEAYIKKWFDGDNWFSATEALEEGLVSEIIDVEIETDLIENPQQLGAKEVYNRFTALFSPEQSNKGESPENNLQINNDPNMKKAIITALALTGVTETSSDTAVIEAVSNHFDKENTKLKEDLAEEKRLRLLAEGNLKTQNESAIAAMLSDAKTKGKITAENEGTYRSIGETSGIDALAAVLTAIPERSSITSRMNSGSKNTSVVRADWNWDKWQTEDPRGLEALATDEPETFEALRKAKFSK